MTGILNIGKNCSELSTFKLCTGKSDTVPHGTVELQVKENNIKTFPFILNYNLQVACAIAPKEFARNLDQSTLLDLMKEKKY